MGSKHLKLVDTRGERGHSVRALRRVLRELDNGSVTCVAIATVRRDGSIYTFSQSEDPVRAIGALSILADDIKENELKKR